MALKPRVDTEQKDHSGSIPSDRLIMRCSVLAGNRRGHRRRDAPAACASAQQHTTIR